MPVIKHFPLAKHNATVAPGVNDDVTLGYEPGSPWTDVTNDKAYVCLDATDGAAVWTETTGAVNAHKDTHDPEDGTDPLDTAAAGVIQPDDASAVGTAHSLARSDHVHQIDADTPNSLDGVQAGAEGTAYEFARSDHDHAIAHSIADNALVTMDDAGPAVAGEYTRLTASGLEGRPTATVLTDIGAQPLEATLTALAGVLTGASKVPYATGADVAAELDLAVTVGDPGSDTTIVTEQGIREALDAAGGGSPWRFIDLPAGAWDYPAANPAPLDTDTGTNGTIKRHLFDDSTEEFVIAQIKVPSDLNASGTVHFEAYGYAVTADGNEIQLRFSHDEADAGETWDGAYTAEDSGDYVTDAQQDEKDEVKWSETVANLGWAADDFVRIMVSRIAIDDGTDLSGDWGLTHFRLKIPRA